MLHERRESRIGWHSGGTRRMSGSQARSKLLELSADLFMRLKDAARERFGHPDYDPVIELMAIGLDPSCNEDTRLRAHATVSKFVYTQRAQLDVNVREDAEMAPPNPTEVADAIIGRLEEVARERRMETATARPREDRAAERERPYAITPPKTNGSGT